MTAAQTKYYWSAWGAACRHCKSHGFPAPDRDAITVAALGKRVSSKDLSNRQLDLILAAFAAISRPADMDRQLRQADQSRQRKEWRIGEHLAELGVYVADPAGYAARLFGDKFCIPAGGALDIRALDDRPGARIDRHGDPVETPSQLDQCLMTLARCVQQHRRAAGDSIHDMRVAAGLTCRCESCRACPKKDHDSLAKVAECATAEDPF